MGREEDSFYRLTSSPWRNDAGALRLCCACVYCAAGWCDSSDSLRGCSNSAMPVRQQAFFLRW